MVALQQRHFGQFLPTTFVVQGAGRFQGDLQQHNDDHLSNQSREERRETHVDVSTFQSQAESRLFVFDEVQGDFGIALLLQVGDDTLSDQLRRSHHVEHFVVLAVDQRQLELEFGRVDVEDARPSFAIETEDAVALDLRDVDRHVERADDAVIAVDQRVLDVIRRRVDEHAGIVPGARFHRHVLLDDAQLFQLAIANDQLVFGQQRQVVHVVRPDGVFRLARPDARQRAFLLGVVQTDVIVLADQQQARARVEDLIAVVQLDFLRDFIFVVFNQNLNREGERGSFVTSVDLRRGFCPTRRNDCVRPRWRSDPTNDDLQELKRTNDQTKNCEEKRRTIGRLRRVVAGVLGNGVEIVDGIVQLCRHPGGEENGVLGRVVRHGIVRRPRPSSQLHQRHVLRGGDFQSTKVLLLDVVDEISHHGVDGTFAFEFENDHAVVVSGGEQVQRGMHGEDPEAIVLPSEGVDHHALGHVPDANRFVFAVGQDQILSRVENDAGNVVVVASAGVHFPGLVVVHSPQLHHAIVGGRDDERQGGVERRPVHSSVVSFEHVLDDGVGLAEQVGRARRALDLRLDRVRRRVDVLLSQSGDVPDAHGLIQRGRDDQILARMELGAHHVMVVSRHHADALT